LSYLRFTPADYQALARACRAYDLARLDLLTFRDLLAAAVAGRSPDLAARVGGFNSGQIFLLQQHLRSGEKGGARLALTAAEWRTLAEWCGSAPGSTRFVGVFHRLLVRQLRKAAPGLARKLEGLNAAQLERLYEQVQRRRRQGGA
jgi:hypothetical protein